MFKKADIPYSLKNIPIPSQNSFMKCMISKTENFIQRLRWKAFYFLEPNQEKTPFRNFGFKTEKSAPQVKELFEFENELFSIIENFEFSHKKSSFQKQLNEDVKKIYNSKNIFMLGDKTSNVYEVSTENYTQLVNNAIHTHYKKADQDTEININKEASIIASKLKIDDRVDKIVTSP